MSARPSRPSSQRNGLAEQASRGMQRQEAAGLIKRAPLTAPTRTFKFTEGFVRVFVRTTGPDGTSRDVVAARALHAGRPYAAIMVHLGVARDMHCFEYDPMKVPA